MDSSRLLLCEEMLLLVLRDKDGVFQTNWVNLALAGAALAELMLEGYLVEEPAKKKGTVIRTAGSQAPGEPILSECWQLVADSKKPRDAQACIWMFSRIKEFGHRVAQGLVAKGILRADEKSILLIFSKRVYPEVNHRPEAELLGRIRRAIERHDEIDDRTAVSVAVAYYTGLLNIVFGRKYIKTHKDRLETIGKGNAAVSGTNAAVSAAVNAAMMASITAATSAATSAAIH